jgi:hypothetical protein
MNKNPRMQENDLAQEQIKAVLEREIVEPFITSVCSDIDVSLKLSAALVLTRYTEQIVINLPVDATLGLNKIKECYLFLGYFGKIYQSSLFTLGSTDYLSATILMRALFELLVGISTDKNGSMRDRIESICFFDKQEKKDLAKTWDLLCAWAHPYGKWAKYVCPKAFGTGRFYNLSLFKQSLDYSHKILDFMLTAIFEILNLSASNYSDSPASFMHGELPMFYKRLNRTNS